MFPTLNQASTATPYNPWVVATVVLADENANLIARHDYIPFGEEIPGGIAGRSGQFGASDNVTQKFTGKERDTETSLDYFGARYYGAGLGRFMSVDPGNASSSSVDPQSWNGYVYARNNPLLYTDPDGENYNVCDAQGQNCRSFDDQTWASFRDANGIQQAGDGTLSVTNDNGSQTRIGNAQYYDPTAGNAVAFLNRSIGALALNYVTELAGPLLGTALRGGRITSLGLKGAAETANVASKAAEASKIISQALSTVGNQSVRVSSRAVAEEAAADFVGPGARAISDRSTGQAVGQISADGTRVARYTRAESPEPYLNFENKATGANLHVRW